MTLEKHGYLVRLAQPEDLGALPAIERLAAAAFTDPALAALFATQTDSALLVRAQQDRRLWVAAAPDSTLVGFAVAGFVDGLPHLEELDVLPEHGRRGLGSSLLETACNWARDAGYVTMTLSTMRDIPFNGPFYERHGFMVLPVAEWTPGLLCLRELEAIGSFPMERRVLMRRLL